MSFAPIKVWGHWGAPNPWKVCIILDELNLPYTIQFVELSEAKEESYLSINPNGRLPAIYDPNNDITLWESGAIIQYLIDQYDTQGKISHKTLPEKYLTQQWLAFQISGQGPYFGQATWFTRFHPENLPSAIDRYIQEIFRVTSVLETALSQNSSGCCLVGDKITYADLAFVTWSSVGEGLLEQLGRMEELKAEFPRYVGWRERMEGRESVRRIGALVAKGRAEHGMK